MTAKPQVYLTFEIVKGLSKLGMFAMFVNIELTNLYFELL